jgi:DNA-binding MarR family transcriptional regulator
VSDRSGWTAIPGWLLFDSEVTTNAKLVYLALNYHADDNGITYPSQRGMAESVGISLNSVKRGLAELEDEGLLVRQVERTPTGRRNRYRLLTDRLGKRWGVSPQ